MTSALAAALRGETVRAAGILFTLLVLTFAPFTLGNKTLLESAAQAQSIMPNGAFAGKAPPIAFPRTKDPGAPSWQTEPLLEVIRYQYFQEHVLPLWNPYQAYGTPLSASMHPQVYYPPSIIQSLFHTPRARNWFILLHLFIAGFCAYRFARLFVSFVPALSTGITSMFAGYYILFLTMPHLSVEVFLPAALLFGEVLIRRPCYRTVAFFAVVTFLTLIAGMPESCCLLIGFAYLYLIIRLITDKSLRPAWLRSFTALLIATISGFCFAAILLLPFRHYLRYAFDNHQASNIKGITGLGFDPDKTSVLTYLFPFIHGTSWDNNLRNYAGLISLFLILTAIFSASWRSKHKSTLSSLTWFFTVMVITIVTKRYGLSFINWIGSLPIFSLVVFPKYEEAELSISVAVLCGIGMERLVKRQVTPLKQACALALTLLVIAFSLNSSRTVIAQLMLANSFSSHITAWTLALPAVLMIVLLFLLFVVNGEWNNSSASARFRTVLAPALLILLSTETIFNYIVPTYYIWNKLPTDASNPYLGAPYVDRLKSLAGGFRIFAEDGVLFPEWPSVFRLSDIRSLDAMNYRRYFPFLRQFFPHLRLQPGGELYDRFTGFGDYPFSESLQQRMLQLSSVKYVVTLPATSLQTAAIDEILSQNQGKIAPAKAWQIARLVLDIAGDVRPAMMEHPPYERLPYHVHVADSANVVRFSYGINPAAYTVCGDGVEFSLEARDRTGAITRLFSNFIDPRGIPSQRKWFDASADISRFRNQDIDLLLTTGAGPKNDNCADWSFWSNIQVGESISPQPFKVVYQNEVKIYEFLNPLPRAAIYYNAEIMPGEVEVLKRLSAPSLDVSRTVLLDGSTLDRSSLAKLRTINSSPSLPVQEARITSYQSQSVIIRASLAQPGILVLNDSNFPGWLAEVDGAPAKIVPANELFRGVLLEPGSHTIKFAYKPWSVRAGGAISLASIFSFAAFGVLQKRRRVNASAAR